MDTNLRNELADAGRKVAAARQQLRSAVTTLHSEVRTATIALHQQLREERVDERFGAAARSGQLGRDMQRAQERIDRGEFSWRDVLTGQVDDESVTNAMWQSLGPLQAALQSEQDEGAQHGVQDRPEDEVFRDPLGWRS